MGRFLSWFNEQTVPVKVIVLVAPVLLFVVASPVFAFLAFLGLLGSLIFLAIRAVRRRPLRSPALLCAGSFALLVAASGISSALYPAEPTTSETAQQSAQEETSSPDSRSDDQRESGNKESAEGDTDPATQDEGKDEVQREQSAGGAKEVQQEVESAQQSGEENSEAPEAPEPTQASEDQAPEDSSEPRDQNNLASSGELVTMTRAVDGDTIEISPTIDGIEDVRLIGIDTPETSSDCGTQPFANEAEQHTAQYTGGEVALEFDEERTDQYGRLLAYVYVPGGDMLNQELTRRGLAQVATFPPNVKYESVFLDAQSESQAESLGIWSLTYQQQLLLEDRGNGIGGGCEAQPEPTTPVPAPQPATPIPEPTPSVPEPTPQPAPEPSAPAVPSGGDVDCSDFSSEAEAAPYLLPGDPHRLDGDGDGRACED